MLDPSFAKFLSKSASNHTNATNQHYDSCAIEKNQSKQKYAIYKLINCMQREKKLDSITIIEHRPFINVWNMFCIVVYFDISNNNEKNV